MMRTFIAVSILTLGVALTVFTLSMAGAYAINERCTEQMAWNGNC